MPIKNKNRDPKSHELSQQDIVINTKEGSMFFKSNNRLYKLKGDDQTTPDINESLHTTKYDLTKLYNFRFFIEDPYTAKWMPAFGGGEVAATTLDYSHILAAPYDGIITEISFTYAAHFGHTFWETEDPTYKIAGHKNTAWVQEYEIATGFGSSEAIFEGIFHPTSHQNMWEHGTTGLGGNEDDFHAKANNIYTTAGELNTQFDSTKSMTNPLFSPLQTQQDKIRRLQVFKFNNFTFKKGDMVAITLEIDNVLASYADGNVSGHATVMYDTSTDISWGPS